MSRWRMCLKWNKNTNEWIFQRIRLSSIDNHIITRGDRIPVSQSFTAHARASSVSETLRLSSATFCVTPTLLKLKLLSGLWHVTWGWAPCFNVRSMASPVLWRWDDGDVTQDVTCHTHDGSHSTLTLDTPKLLSCLREESHFGQQTAPPDHSTPADEKAQVTAGSLNCKSNPLFWRDILQTQIWWQEQF